MAKRNSLLHILVLLRLSFLTNYVQAALPTPRLSKPNCTDHCGNITNIPYPFGMGRSECFWDEWFEIDCRNGTIPFLKKLNLEVLNVSLSEFGDYDEPTVSVNFPTVVYQNSSCSTKGTTRHPPSLQGSTFTFSIASNTFTTVGCDVTALMNNSYFSLVGCNIECSGGGDFSRNNTCSGFNDSCCQTPLPFGIQTFTVEFIDNIPQDETGLSNGTRCNYALLANSSWLRPEFTDLDSVKRSGYAPVVLRWGVANDSDHAKELNGRKTLNANYRIFTSWTYDHDIYPRTIVGYGCNFGYVGNPYLIDGCQDVDECEYHLSTCPKRCVNTMGSFKCVDPYRTLKLVFIGIGAGLGALLLVFLGWRLYKIIKKRNERKLKEKYFKRNGGLVLQQQLLSSAGNVLQGKLFNQKEMEMATEYFSETRVLGRGGQGTVYKGMLTDGRVVAIKKALVIDEEKVEQFINEVIILTQISHRNVVQLLGCCLETKIPLLVYEFIPNGNLYEYLHGFNKEDSISWEMRLQLAIEIAGALFYLHSAASIPVYHRDIKSTNILLDEKYQAKIADFGTSRLVAIDKTHVTTLVQGTFGYLDPEFFQTTQFTDKSDVYSFGVVLVELLTREKPICTMRTEEGINLAAHFILSLEDGRLFDILDAEILNQGAKEEILNVANLATRCLHLHGRDRPTMREVIIELEGIKKLRNMSNIQGREESHVQDQCQDIIRSASARFEVDTNVMTSLDDHPLLLGTP